MLTPYPVCRRQWRRRQPRDRDGHSHTMFLSAIAPNIPMSPGRFPVEQWLSREAGLIYMAQNALKNMVWLCPSLSRGCLLRHCLRHTGYGVSKDASKL